VALVRCYQPCCVSKPGLSELDLPAVAAAAAAAVTATAAAAAIVTVATATATAAAAAATAIVAVTTATTAATTTAAAAAAVAAATAAATTAAAAVAAATAATTATAAFAGLTLLSEVDAEVASVQFLPVKRRNGGLGIFRGSHVNKGKPAGATSVTESHDLHVVDSAAIFFKSLAKGVVGSVPGKVADIESVRHSVLDSKVLLSMPRLM
jgi:hypothetical protein